jgi:hypothetical protein
MNNQKSNDFEEWNHPEENLISACGLYCGACGIYIATQENDADKILQYAVVLKQSYDETLCDGCGSKRKSLHCLKTCTFIDCKLRKGVNMCYECIEFPCQELVNFKSKMPHRAEIIDSLIRMKEIGKEPWLSEMKDLFSCTQCNTLNSAYHLTCRKCKKIPSCKFVSLHIDDIENYLSK